MLRKIMNKKFLMALLAISCNAFAQETSAQLNTSENAQQHSQDVLDETVTQSSKTFQVNYKQNNQFIGAATYQIMRQGNDRRGCIHALEIVESLRRKGLALIFIFKLLQRMHETGGALWVYTHVDDDRLGEPARKFLEKVGFEAIEHPKYNRGLWCNSATLEKLKFLIKEKEEKNKG